MIWGTIFLGLVGLLILYVVIFAAVRDGIDKSEVGQILRTKYGVKEEIVTVSDEEIEKELDGYDR